MTKRILTRKPRKNQKSVALVARKRTQKRHTRKPTEDAAAKPAEAPAPITTPEPTFTLSEFAEAFGGNYGPLGDPLTFAVNALDDAKRSLYLLTLAINVPGDDGSGFEDVLTNTWYRVGAALEILNKFRPCVVAKAQVQS